jgi:hypothetical protein
MLSVSGSADQSASTLLSLKRLTLAVNVVSGLLDGFMPERKRWPYGMQSRGQGLYPV